MDNSDSQRAIKIVHVLRRVVRDLPDSMVDIIIQDYGKNTYFILISCLLSLRAKDITILPVCRDLFREASTPEAMIRLSLTRLQKIIFKSGFYRQKAKTLKAVSQELIDRFGGIVPHTASELLSIKGIGQKTAHLVLYKAFDRSTVFVDTHVHRLSNRLGLVATKTPDQTRQALERLLPERYRGEYCHLLVRWGQNICVPISPFCSRCALYDLCPRKGVVRHR